MTGQRLRAGALGALTGALLLLASCSSDEEGESTPPAQATTTLSTATTVATTATPTPPRPTAPTTPAATATGTAAPGATPRDATYEIERRPVTLVAGVSDVPAAPGSASRVVTRYFGNEVSADFNGDGLPDVGFVLTQSSGGSGTFFYAAVALRTRDGGYVGTNAVLLGDRIAPQTTEARDGTLIVNYADRKPGEPMTTRPSVGVSKYLKVVGGRLTE